MTNAIATAPITPSPARWLQLMPAALVAVVTFAVGAASAYSPPATGEMGVVFPPWVGEVEALERVAEAGGRIIGPSRLSNIVVAYAPDAGFAERVGRLGALFTTKATGICGPASQEVPE